MKFPLHFVIYAIILLGLPIVTIILSTIMENTPVGTYSLLLIFASMIGSFMIVPKKFEDIGFANARRAYLLLKYLRKSWLIASLGLAASYGLIFYSAGTLSIGTFLDLYPEFGFVPITMIISLFYLTFTSFALIFWRNSRVFPFFMARESIKVALNKRDKLEKLDWLFECLAWYFLYARLAFGMNVSNIDKITSTILTRSGIDRDRLVEDFYKGFVDGDELEPMVVINSLLNNGKGDELLVTRDFLTRFKELAIPIGLILASITALVSLWNTFILPLLPK
jgi:hypothetical protein